ncbi:MAG TPA: hypothetical protein PK816_02805 [Candidatus Cloacimonadota bacterium]|nr:hypothetical protein [Candidatus Cloacimonadota bacterium]
MRNRIRRLLARIKSSRVVENPANAYTTGVYNTCQYSIRRLLARIKSSRVVENPANAYTTGVYNTCQYS